MIRNITDSDFEPLAELITSEAAPCQPRCTPAMIQNTLARKSTVDQGFYDDLTSSEILVYENRGSVVGAIAFGVSKHGITDILWMAGEACPEVLDELIAEVESRASGPLRAYWYAATVSAALEGLPVQARPRTHQALLKAGFQGEDQWSYQVLENLEPPAQPSMPQITEYSTEVEVDGQTVGAYEVGVFPDDRTLGELWWMEVYPQHQGYGHGNTVLAEALEALGALGATRVHLVVDDDDPTERDRRPAKHLYANAGFAEVDRLWSYFKGDLPADQV